MIDSSNVSREGLLAMLRARDSLGDCERRLKVALLSCDEFSRHPSRVSADELAEKFTARLEIQSMPGARRWCGLDAMIVELKRRGARMVFSIAVEVGEDEHLVVYDDDGIVAVICRAP